MNRSDQIRTVFRELRSSVGDQISSAQVLVCATSLVELFSGSGEDAQFDARTGGLPFSMWGVDRALADAWRLLEQESVCDEDIIDEISKELCLHNGFARVTMGACL
jgi:hypothetical protein